jgi:sugar-specific transcriptional regulator TrmB
MTKNTVEPKVVPNPLIPRLVAFGLSEQAAAIYLKLLNKAAPLGGSELAASTGLKRQYVYAALPRLIELGLVEEVPRGKYHHYTARPPAELEKIGRRRAVDASDLAHDLNEVSNIGNQQDFEVIQGTKAIRRYEMDYALQAPDGSEEFIIGGASVGFSGMMSETLEAYLLEKRRRGIKVKYIGSADEAEPFRAHAGKYKNQEYRFLKDLPKGMIHTVIRHDSVCIFSFLNPPLLYVMKSRDVAENYGRFFQMLWATAKA